MLESSRVHAAVTLDLPTDGLELVWW